MSTVAQRFTTALEFHGAGRAADARRLYEEIVGEAPGHHAAWAHLGLLELKEGRFDAAAASFGRAIGIAPNEPDYHVNLGVVHWKAGRLEAAAAAMTRAVALDPNRAESHFNLAVVLDELKVEFSLSAFERAARLAPESAVMSRGFAAALTRKGLLGRAADEWRRAADLEPSSAASLVELSTVLRLLGDNDGALDAARRALDVDPRALAAKAELGATLIAVGRLDEAEDTLRQAVEQDPTYAAALFNLASALILLGRADEGIAALRRILTQFPDEPQARTNLVLALNYSSTADDHERLREAVDWGARHGLSKPAQVTPKGRAASPDGRLRIGYFCADFGGVTPFLPSLFEHHDGDTFEITCYSGVPSEDPDVLRMKRTAHQWREVYDLSDEDLADSIRADEIDVLVDLTMHMAGSRLAAFATKPAPVQIAWLAYPGTTGLPAMDYRLTDRHLDPEGAPNLPYTERSLFLPDSFWLYGERHASAEPGPLPATRNGFVTFGCLNTFSKYHDGVPALFSKVLQAAPGSKLLLLVPAGKSERRVRSAFERGGVAAERIECVPRMPLQEYLETYRRIDVCLDTFPCNGHTTSLDAAWMGVPTVSLVSRHSVVGRGGLSIARNLGLPELARNDEDGFVAEAVALGRVRDRLASLRESLRARLRASPLMDAPRFARHLEHAYRTAFRAVCGAAESRERAHSA